MSGRTPPALAWRRADISIRMASPALALLCGALAACSTSPPVEPPGQPDADADADPSGDAGGCALPLDAPQPWGTTCPTTFDDTSWRAKVVCTVSERLRETTCTGYLSLAFDIGGTHGFTCYYDPASKVLVAVQSYDDVPDLRDGCGTQSSVVTAGAVPPMGVCGAPKTLDSPCHTPDAGADSTGTDASGLVPGKTACLNSATAFFFTACVHECGETATREPVAAECVQGLFQCPSPLTPAPDCPPGSWISPGLPCGPWPAYYNCGSGCAVCDATGAWTCGSCPDASAG